MEELIKKFLGGSGYGSGSGYGDLHLTTYNGQPVYYIDDIPCYFISINKNLLFAKVVVINISDFSITPQFVFKFNGCFAHGDTLKEAKRDAENKYYAQLDVSERISAFNKAFNRGVKYDAQLFYDWHSTLTGSCETGKSMFIKQHAINLDSKLTVDEFISITKNAYGGEIIKQLAQ